MKLTVLIPVGPGHEAVSRDAEASVVEAWVNHQGPFTDYSVHSQFDPHGQGRGKTRNLLLAEQSFEPRDFVFWLDADDLMAPDALLGFQTALEAQPALDAIWGTISCQRGQEPFRVRPAQVYPKNYSDLIRAEPSRTLQSGFFVRGQVAQAEPWNETMREGEDFEMYFRLWRRYRCTKSPSVFMLNRRGVSASGPQASDGRQWRIAVERLMLRLQREETREK